MFASKELLRQVIAHLVERKRGAHHPGYHADCEDTGDNDSGNCAAVESLLAIVRMCRTVRRMRLMAVVRVGRTVGDVGAGEDHDCLLCFVVKCVSVVYGVKAGLMHKCPVQQCCL